MDWCGLKNKSWITKNQKASEIVLDRKEGSNEENEVKQSLLSESEKSCLAKSGRNKEANSARKVRWKDDCGNMLAQVKIYQPDVDLYDDLGDADIDIADFCSCRIM